MPLAFSFARNASKTLGNFYEPIFNIGAKRSPTQRYLENINKIRNNKELPISIHASVEDSKVITAIKYKEETYYKGVGNFARIALTVLNNSIKYLLAALPTL